MPYLPAAQEVVQHPDAWLRGQHPVQPHRVHAPVDLRQDAHLPRVFISLQCGKEPRKSLREAPTMQIPCSQVDGHAWCVLAGP